MHFATLLLELMLLVWFSSFFANMIGTISSLCFLRSSLPTRSARCEGISILKPLSGIDGPVEKNLESFFLLDYPNYEILFSVADETDPVILVVKKLLARYPNQPARLIIKNVNIGPNPKINNLISGYSMAKFDWILISDSNIRATKNYLKELAVQFTDDIGMLSSVVAGRNASSLVGQVESNFLNTLYARSMIVSNCFGHACMLGKSLLFRKVAMEKIGGLQTLGPYLAEDYVAGTRFQEAGFKAVVSRVPVRQFIGAPSLRSSWARHVRWGRIRKVHALPLFCFELPLLSALLSGLIGAIAVSKLHIFGAVPFFALHLSIWFLADCLLLRKISKLSWKMPFFWILQELSHFPLWVHIASSNSIRWKGHSWKLQRYGTLL